MVLLGSAHETNEEISIFLSWSDRLASCVIEDLNPNAALIEVDRLRSSKSVFNYSSAYWEGLAIVFFPLSTKSALKRRRHETEF
jgi:hypothetical protein